LDKPKDIRKLAGMEPDKIAELKAWLLKSDERNFAAAIIRNGYLVPEVERGNSAKTDAPAGFGLQGHLRHRAGHRSSATAVPSAKATLTIFGTRPPSSGSGSSAA
jgi:hypothetical protein